ncbi:hypothetical protein [Lewinella sp. LCG006]|uniref:hypothetical protein n=1 Tax=Lewinella sp. LCG006 TaxID=3231911 RepID=UPI003460018E
MGTKLFFSLVLLLAASSVLEGQDKQEQELRIASEAAPKAARAWLSLVFGDNNRIKWYAETTSGRQSIEAKFKHQRRHFSVEFSPTGELEDVESVLKLRQIPDSTRRQLIYTFKTLPKFKLNRIQEQWQGSTEGIRSALQGRFSREVLVQYEIEFSAKMKGIYGIWEGTFSKNGELLTYRQIVLRPTTNLNY